MVAFAFEKSKWAAIAMTAVMKAGGICVPLNPNDPQLRQEEIMKDVGANIIICSPLLKDIVSSDNRTRVIVSESFCDQLEARSDLPCSEVRPWNGAFLVFTSGSTGKPKGIIQEHVAMSTSVRDHGAAMQMKSDARTYQFSAYTFDTSVSDMFGTFLNGGCACLPSDHDRMNNLADSINALEANLTCLTPAVVDQLWPEEVPGLKVLCVGGEALTQDIVNRWSEKVKLINVYGVTECLVWCISTGFIQQGASPANMGKAVCGRAWIASVEDYNKLAPIGGVGELLIEGPNLARHYYNNPAKTNESFVSTPDFLKSNTSDYSPRVYRTGDLVQYSPDGTINYIGRRDSQVKVNGHRVSFGEIEHQIKLLVPKGTEVVCDVMVTAAGDKSLVVFLSLKHDPYNDSLAWKARYESLTAQVEHQLSLSLAPYLVPHHYVHMEHMPLTSSGKMDRIRLVRMATERATPKPVTTGEVAILTETEKTLQSLWATVFKLNPTDIDPSANFLHLGDSIAAMKLVSAARRKGYSLTVSNIFQNPILHDMASPNIFISKEFQDELVQPFTLLNDFGNQTELVVEATRQCECSQNVIEDIYPCSSLQEGLMAASLKQPGSYVAQDVLELSESIDLEKFKRSWEVVVRKHAIFRTRMFETGAGMLQAVIREEIDWLIEDNLEAYLARDKENLMGLGKNLNRFALITRNGKSTMVLTHHHSVYDGFFIPLIYEQVNKVYQGHALGPIANFNTFIKHLEEGNNNASREFWHSELKDATATNFPPLSAPLVNPETSMVCRHSLNFQHPPKANFTASTLFRAAWALLIRGYCGTNDIVLGTTLAGRTAPVANIENIMGPTLTTIPVRVSIDSTHTIERFLKKLQDQTIAMTPHEHFGLHNIRHLGDAAEAACGFQSLLVVQTPKSSSTDTVFTSGTEPEEMEETRTNALTLQIWPNSDGARLVASYDPRALEEQQLLRILQQFERIVLQLCTLEQKRRIQELDLLTPQDYEQIQRWNSEEATSHRTCVHHVINENVLRNPKAPAVSSWDGELSYHQLDQLSSKLAFHLIESGVGPEVKVPFCFEKSLWAIVGILAIIKAGGVYVALDPSHPTERIQAIVEDVKATIILCSAANAKRCKRMVDSVYIVNQLALDNLPEAGVQPQSLVTSQNALYIQFTSGTTGKPKGAVIEHGSYCTAFYGHQKVTEIHSMSRVLQFASYSFDVTNQDILTTLMAGGCLCIPSESERHDNIVGAINKYKVNNANLTPSFAKLIAPSDVPTLQVLQLAGEAMTVDAIQTWGERVHLINGYGPSECCCVCSVNPHATSPERDAGNIGYAAGCRLWIVDVDNPERLAPIGNVGELVIEGAIVGRGYLNDKEKTESAFLNKPVWLEQNSTTDGRVYKTGDLVRYSYDGSINYVGRKDSQVKLRGQRIELGEIESQMIRHVPSAVDIAVQVVVPAGSKNKTLAAFIAFGRLEATAGEDQDVESKLAGELTKAVDGLEMKLSQALPAYMIPTAFVALEEMPLTMSQKIDRKTLQTIASRLTIQQMATTSTSQSSQRKTLSSLEARLRAVWSKVLDIEEHSIGVDDSFMRLGGDSIDAIKLVALARVDGMLLAVVDIFRYPRLSDMTLVIRENVTDLNQEHIKPFGMIGDTEQVKNIVDVASNQCHISQDQIEDIYPSTPLQQGMIALSMIQPGMVVSFKYFNLRSDVDLARFKASWENVVRLNPILRTRVVQIESELLQVVTKAAVTWKLAEDLETYRNIDSQSFMHLGDELIRFAIIESPGSGYYRFCMTLHHFVYDGWSLGLILDQFENIYRGEKMCSSSPFSSFIEYLGSDDRIKQSEDFWKLELSGANPDIFPAPKSGSKSVQADSTISSHFTLPEISKSDITISNIIRGAWAMIVATYTGNDDVIYGTTVAGRHAPLRDIEKIVGPTFATVPIRIQVDLEQKVGKFLDQLQHQSFDMIPFEQIGLQYIRRLGPEAEAACNFQNILIIQPPAEETKKTGVLGSSLSPDDMTDFNTYGLMLECQLQTDGFTLNANFDQSLIDEAQMARLLAQFAHTVRQLCHADNDTSLKDLDMISKSEKMELADWESPEPESVQACIHDLISVWARKQPNSEAIVSWDGQLNHGDLDSLSNQLALHLTELGIGAEMFVPICFKKSLWTIVSMLAVLKAGAAFVPLDASHPVSRLENIVTATDAKLILCSQENSGLFQDTDCATFVVEADVFKGPRLPESSKLPEGLPQHAAYCMFTSGSTGKPKGVVIEHSAFATTARAEAQMFGVTSDSRVLQFASYSFDTSLFEILTTLISGGCVCIPSEEERREPSAIATAISRMRINMAGLTPSYVDVITPSSISTVKTLILGGEPLKTIHVDTWASCVKLMSAYGPTECSVTCSINNDMAVGSDPRNIGRPAGATRWIVDPKDANRLRPVGVVGELVIEGPLLARGYLNNPEKEREAFVEGNAFLGTGQRRRYKTGDLVRYNHDGSMTYVARKDNQVKLRGQRLEVEEVEHHISTYDAVMHCLVSIPKSGAWEKQLVGVISLNDPLITNEEKVDGNLIQLAKASNKVVRESITGLTAYLAVHLPEHMIPTMWIVVDEIPYTKAMKLDRVNVEKFLTSMDVDSEAKARNLIEPETDISHCWSESEERLRKIWSDILKTPIENVAFNSNFFRLGGDSIAAMRLVEFARSKGFFLTVPTIFGNPQFSAMFLVASKRGEASNTTDVPRLSMIGEQDLEMVISEASRVCQTPVDMIEDIYPCTPLQEGLMALSNQSPGSYVMQHVEAIPAHYDLTKFYAAWEHVSESHHVLRSRIFPGPQGTWLQAVVQGKLNWNYAEDLEAYLKQDLIQPMIFGEPLVRFAIVHERKSDHKDFVFTAHHSMYDGESLSQLLKRVRFVLQNLAYQEPASFKNFINYLHCLDSRDGVKFWKSKLEGYTAPSWPHLPSQSYQPMDDSVLIRDMPFHKSSTSTFTPSTIMRAAWAIILSKYMSTNDVVFGATLTGRNANLPGIMDIPGPTITTVPLRITFGDESVKEILQRTQDDAITMIPFEHTGLQNIKHISPDSQAACTFQTLLVVQPAQEEDMTSPVFESENFPAVVDSPASLTYALSMFCELGTSSIRLKANFDSQCITNNQVERILHQMEHVVQQLCSENIQGDVLVRDLEVISPSDKLQLAEWNIDEPPQATYLLLDRFSAISQVYPSKMAVDAWDGCFNYEELDLFSSQLAINLIEDGVGTGDIIPLCFEKSKWNVIAMLGVMKAGAAFNPLDPTVPEDRLQKLVQLTGAKTILCSMEKLELSQNLVKNVKEVSTRTMSTANIAAPSVMPDIQFSNDLYVMFTSGSTGVPKGVVIQHGAMATSAEAHGPRLDINESSRVLQFSGHTWDVSILEFFTTLSLGACICIPSDFDRMNNLHTYMNDVRVTVMTTTPSVARTLTPEQVPGLKTLALIGESWGQEIMNVWGGKVRVINAYGPTEASVLAVIGDAVPEQYRKNNIGVGVGARTWIADPDNHNILMPIGCLGELLLEGHILARGYLNDDDKTNQAFVTTPRWATENFIPGQTPPSRLYRTGDLVRYQDDGTLKFDGRKDSQTKIRGQRVELEEIEHNVSAEKLVQSALVYYPSSGLLKGQLVAVVCLVKSYADGENSSKNDVDNEPALIPSSIATAAEKCEEICINLSTILADYMIPNVWLPVEKMPLLASGKISRKFLNSWISSMTSDDFQRFSRKAILEIDQIVAPTTSTEELMQSVWSDVLQITRENISINASFTSLGGDSVSAMLIVSRCRARGFNITVRDILQSRTIANIASVAQIVEETLEEKKVIQTKPEPLSFLQNFDVLQLAIQTLSKLGITDLSIIEDVFLCLPVQQEMLSSQKENEQFYRVQGVFRIVTSLDTINMDRLEQAWQQLVARHSVLRSRFTDQVYHTLDMYQIVLKTVDFNISKFSTDDAESAIELLNNTTLSSMTSPFGIAVCTTDDGQTFCKLEANHAIIDHVSIGVLLEELRAEYLDSSATSSLVQGPVYRSFVDYTKLQQSASSLGYWNTYLQGCKSQPLETLSTDSPQTLKSFPIQVGDAQDLRAFCETNHMTLFNLIQTAWAVLLHKHTNSEEVGFCYLLSNRDAMVEGAAEMVGLLVNILPTRLAVSSTTAITELSQTIRDHFADGLGHASSGFERKHHLIEEGGHSRRRFDTLINYRGRVSAAEMDKESAMNFELVDGQDPMDYTFVLAIEDSDQGPSFLLSFWKPCITEEYAARVAADFSSILSRITERSGISVGEF
ncbi:non-ribosomal peptide synthetase protein [Phlyctema vagabunda]|uniref:Non-ribosomal peptide synthetase protein n=1 Tax=Phlyctema vagabunda TaxID=108571 RepID=A0ABR4PCJ5_9HELO